MFEICGIPNQSLVYPCSLSSSLYSANHLARTAADAYMPDIVSTRPSVSYPKSDPNPFVAVEAPTGLCRTYRWNCAGRHLAIFFADSKAASKISSVLLPSPCTSLSTTQSSPCRRYCVLVTLKFRPYRVLGSGQCLILFCSLRAWKASILACSATIQMTSSSTGTGFCFEYCFSAYMNCFGLVGL